MADDIGNKADHDYHLDVPAVPAAKCVRVTYRGWYEKKYVDR